MYQTNKLYYYKELTVLPVEKLYLKSINILEKKNNLYKSVTHGTKIFQICKLKLS